jgi:hypothetical protein
VVLVLLSPLTIKETKDWGYQETASG